MSSDEHKPANSSSLYPDVILTNPEAPPPGGGATNSNLYPPVEALDDMAENERLIPAEIDDEDGAVSTKEEVLMAIPGAVVHLIERERSVELGSGEFRVVSLKQGETVVAVLARVGEGDVGVVQWPLAKDGASVKLDGSHYFFTLRVPPGGGGGGDGGPEMLNYGVTFSPEGKEEEEELDGVLERYTCFEVQRVEGGSQLGNWEEVVAAREAAGVEAYWTTLAPNVEEYSSSFARMIAAGSGQVVKGILWCGEVTVDGLRWGNEVLKARLGKKGDYQEMDVSPATFRRIQSVKRLTKMSEKVATGLLSGVVKVSGFITSSIVNSKVGKMFFSILPGEIVLASLDGYSKVCDAVEVAGKNVLSTSSVFTTGLVSQRYGEKAAKATNEGLDAAGHAIGTALAVFKITKSINPKSAIKPKALAKAAAEANSPETKAKYKK